MGASARESRGWALAAAIGLVIGAIAGAWWTALYSSNPQDISSPAATVAVVIVAGIVLVGAAALLLMVMPSYRPLGVQLLVAVIGSAVGAVVVGFIGAALLGPGT